MVHKQHQKQSYCTEDGRRFLMPRLDFIEMTDYHHSKYLATASETHQYAERPQVKDSHPKVPCIDPTGYAQSENKTAADKTVHHNNSNEERVKTSSHEQRATSTGKTSLAGEENAK